MYIHPSIHSSFKGQSPSFILLMITSIAHMSPGPLYSPLCPTIPPSIHRIFSHETKRRVQQHSHTGVTQKDTNNSAMLCLFTLVHAVIQTTTKREQKQQQPNRTKTCRSTNQFTLLFVLSANVILLFIFFMYKTSTSNSILQTP